MWDLSFWPPGVCLHWGVHQNLDVEFLRTCFSGREISVLGRRWCGFPGPKPGNVLDVNFRTWDPQFLATWSLHSGFPRPKTWEILGYGFQDVGSQLWGLDFTLAVSKTETWKLLGRDFQDVGSQFWDLDFTLGASHDPGPGIFWHMIFRTWDLVFWDLKISNWGVPWPRTWKLFRTSFSRRVIPSLGPGFHIRGFQRSKPGNS